MERFAGRFGLVRMLGKGGMGEVWLALDHTSGTECALKRLDLHLPRAARDSLKREFEVLSRLRHPAIVAVHELGFSAEGRGYVTMEFVPGLPADDAVRGRGIPAVLDVALRVAEGLEALHSAGLVHGDVKPSNLLVIPDVEKGAPAAGLKIVDFGLSALLERDREGHRGTVGYAAPEVVRGRALSVASDLYSFGVTLCVLAAEALGGHSGAQRPGPPSDAAAAALLLSELDAAGPLRQWILHCLAEDPTDRPASMALVRAGLERLRPGSRPTLRTRIETELMVGRGREWVRLERWLFTPGDRPLMLLEGGSGIGKSTLLRSLGARGTLANVQVISLACTAGTAPGELGRRLLMRLAAAAEASGEPVAGTEAVRRQLEDGAPGDSSELSAWADAGAVWAQAIAAHETLLVLLDDVDRLDARSLTLVRRVAATAAGRSIRWLWAGAPGLVAEGSPESLLVQAGWAERMSLGPLEPSESMALIGARLRTTPPMVLADFLRERCGGHAGFTVEVLRRAADVGAIREGASGLVVDRALLDGMPLPADFTAACLQRLDGLTADATLAARALAVWDAPLSASALPRFGVTDAELAIEALHAAGLLVRHDHGDVVLQPPAVARALLAGLADSEREAIGRRALAEPGLSHEQRFRLWRSMGDPVPALAEAEQAFRLRPEITLAVQAAGLADSFGDVALGGAWNGRAGRQLFAHGRHREAIPYLEKAIKVTAPSPERELWICELLGNYLRTGAHETWRAQIERFSAEPVGPVCRVGLLLSREAYHYTRGELVECRRLHAEAAQVAEACGDEGARGLVAMIRSLYAHRVDHRGGDAIPLAERAIEHYRRAGDVRGRLRAVGALGAALWAAQRVHECRDVLEEALAEARALDLPLVLAELLTSRIVMLVVAGDWRSALDRMTEALRICIEAGWPAYASFHMTTLTLFSAMVGDTQKAMRIAPRMLRLARRHAPLGMGGAWRAVGVAARNHGRRQLAERSFALALRAQPLGAAPLEYQWIRLEHGTMKAWHGHWAEALEIWRSALLEHDAPDMLESVLLHLQCARGRLRLEAETTGGELERASVEAWCIESGHPLARAHALHFDAEWHLINGRVEATIAAVRGCFAAYEQFPSPADVAHAALAFARLGHRSPIGPRLPLTEWAEKAAAGFQRLGDRVSRHDAMELAIECYRSRRTTSPKASRDRELLQGVGRLVESISDFEQLSKAAMQLAVDELDAERGLLLIASGRGGDEADLAPVVEHGAVDAETLGKALGYSRKAVRRMRESGEPLLIRDAATELEGHSQSVVDLGLRSILCVPLIAEERLIGAVYLDDRRRSHAFGNMERDQLVSFAELLAVAIQRSRGHDAVQRENAELLGENLVLRRKAGRRLRPANFIGSSQAMQRTLAVVERAAKTERTVLITGENGTGKELIARMIHHSGPRADKPFIEVNCGAISGDLMVSELFGIEGRVASGVDRRPGLFRAANGGTLFLDEIGDMSMPGQIALLRALAERTVVPVGGSRPVPVDVRVVAATNQDLAGLIERGSFRRDLFFRINVLPVEVPPLRERRSDIPALTRHFAAAVAAKEGRDVPTLSRELLDVLMESEWPGNVRELENYIERLMTLQIENVLVPDPLPFDLRQGGVQGGVGRAGQRLPDRSAEFERLAVVEALERHGWHQSRAARDLGLTEQSIRYRIRKFKLLRPR